MSNGKDPFELEPEEEPRKPAVPPPAAREVARRRVEETREEDAGVDTRTVAERRGEERPRGALERLPPPPGWPAEAFGFPLRKPGPSLFVIGGIALVALDLLGAVEALRFPAWMFKLLLLVFLLRAQFHVIGTSAAGRDGPEGWREALAFDFDELKLYWRTLLFFAGVLAPGTVLWLFDKTTPGVLLLAAGSMYAAVVAMGAGLRDPALKWPWHALKWMALRPLHCLVGSLGWWVLLGSEIALAQLAAESTVVYGFVAVVLRVACIYVLLLSARAIGVMGRAWTA